MAPVVRKLRAEQRFRTTVVTTGQHVEMLDQVLTFFDIKPDIVLNVMQSGQPLAELTAKMLSSVGSIIRELNPSVTVVHGDTTTTLAASLASFYAQVPIAHVEAGLRTNNLSSPWPEEANRKLTGCLAKYHFAPTEQAKRALELEGHEAADIWVTGNTVIDALLEAVELLDTREEISIRANRSLPVLKPGYRRILVTGHRRENFSGGLASLCDALIALMSRGDIDVVFPIHLNPVVQEVVRKRLAGYSSIHLLPPLDYPAFVTAMRSACLILTDSGGIQEEAPTLGKPVLVLRDTTERPEALAAGTALLIGTDLARIVEETSFLLDNNDHYLKMSMASNPYGDGHASARIVSALKERLLGRTD